MKKFLISFFIVIVVYFFAVKPVMTMRENLKNLKYIQTLQEDYFKTHGKYSADFEEIGFREGEGGYYLGSYCPDYDQCMFKNPWPSSIISYEYVLKLTDKGYILGLHYPCDHAAVLIEKTQMSRRVFCEPKDSALCMQYSPFL